MVDIRTQLMEGRLDLPRHGEVRATESPSLPFVVVDAAGCGVEPVSRFLRDLVLSDRSVLTCRSYAVDLLRWWRLLDVLAVGWDRATTDEVAVLVGWLRAAPNRQRTRRPGVEAVNTKTGKAHLAPGYAPSTINHALSVLFRSTSSTPTTGAARWSTRCRCRRGGGRRWRIAARSNRCHALGGRRCGRGRHAPRRGRSRMACGTSCSRR